jgi:hypothetical protein
LCQHADALQERLFGRCILLSIVRQSVDEPVEGRREGTKDIPALLETVFNMGHDIFKIPLNLVANGNGGVAEGNECYTPPLGAVPHDFCDDDLLKDLSAGLSSVAIRYATATCKEFSQKATLSYDAKVGTRAITMRLTKVSRWFRRKSISEIISL